MILGDFNVPISVETVLILLLVGAAIKHLKMFENVNNRAIPVLLFGVGILITVLDQWPITLVNIISIIITALSSSLLAVGIHSSGKNIFVNGQFIDLFMKSFMGLPELPIENANIENVDTKQEDEVTPEEKQDEEPEKEKDVEETETIHNDEEEVPDSEIQPNG